MKSEICETISTAGIKSGNQNNSLKIDPILKLPDVLEVTSLGKTAPYKMIGDGSFPRQIRLGPRSVGWRQSAVAEWINPRPFVESCNLVGGE